MADILQDVRALNENGDGPSNEVKGLVKMLNPEFNPEHYEDARFLGRGTVTVSQIFYTSPSRCAVADSCAVSLDRRMADAGQIVVACGGGGIPVIREGNHLRGAGAVIDKDFASELLAEELDADSLIILTAVEKVAVNFGKPDQKWLDAMTEQKLKGVAVIYVGEDLDVLLELCDRILVLCGGQVSGIVPREEATKEGIGLMMTQFRKEGQTYEQSRS